MCIGLCVKTNKEMIEYIEKTICEKGYSLNTFKIEMVYGEVDVVWNIARYPHILCEYYRSKGIKIAPIKGAYGLTSLIFEVDAFPKKFYALADNVPNVKEFEKEIKVYTADETIGYLKQMYPSIVEATMEHYPDLDNKSIIDELINLFKFDDFIIKNNDKYYVEIITNFNW